MENVITEELIQKAIIMALANIEMEEDFCFNNEDIFFKGPQSIEQKVKKKVLDDDRHLG